MVNPTPSNATFTPQVLTGVSGITQLHGTVDGAFLMLDTSSRVWAIGNGGGGVGGDYLAGASPHFSLPPVQISLNPVAHLMIADGRNAMFGVITSAGEIWAWGRNQYEFAARGYAYFATVWPPVALFTPALLSPPNSVIGFGAGTAALKVADINAGCIAVWRADPALAGQNQVSIVG